VADVAKEITMGIVALAVFITITVVLNVPLRRPIAGASDSSPHYVIADTSLDLRVPPPREDLRLGD
jgi:hypothetical protein